MRRLRLGPRLCSNQGMSSASRVSGDPSRSDGLFEEILSAPDRDHGLTPRPVVSYRDDDEGAYLDRIDACALRCVPLSRRGLWHGQWAELDPEALGARAPGHHGPGLRQRWIRQRPTLLAAVAPELMAQSGDELRQALNLYARLTQEAGLRRWLGTRSSELEPHFRILSRNAPLADPERDLERVDLRWHSSDNGPHDPPRRRRRPKQLWIKSAHLSDHPDDPSLRLRFGFGREGHDDSSRDGLRQRLSAELATRLLPGARLASENAQLATLLESLCGEPVLLTQHIAYWNCPEGGALFHHDAFDEDPLDRQLGVLYLQLSGHTAWLALSLEDLCLRVREFAGYLDLGELPWVRAQLFGDPRRYGRFQACVSNPRALASELCLPGCGQLGSLVNRGPEFSSFLADAGHALILGPGEGLLLPNAGLGSTAMHSVFCASEGITYGISHALRRAQPRHDPPGRLQPEPEMSEMSEKDRREQDGEIPSQG